MPLSIIIMDMQDIGYFLHMEECDKKIKEVVQEDFYITEEEKEFIEEYRKADNVTKKVILSIYGIEE